MERTALERTDDFLAQLAREATDEWWRMTCACMGALYLHYLPSCGSRPGALRVLADSDARKPEGFELADPRRLSAAWDRETAFRWIYQIARRLPILPVS